MVKILWQRAYAEEKRCTFVSTWRQIGWCVAMCLLYDCQLKKSDDMRYVRWANHRMGEKEYWISMKWWKQFKVIADLTSTNTQRQKERYVLPVLYDRIPCTEKAGKQSYLLGVRIERETARCGASHKCSVDIIEMNVIYDDEKAPWRRCVKIETSDKLKSQNSRCMVYLWRRRDKKVSSGCASYNERVPVVAAVQLSDSEVEVRLINDCLTRHEVAKRR